MELHHFGVQLLFLSCVTPGLLPFSRKPDAIAVQRPSRDLPLWGRGMPTESSGQTMRSLLSLATRVLCASLAYPCLPEHVGPKALRLGANCCCTGIHMA